MAAMRFDWTREEIQEIFDKPLMQLIFDAAVVHRVHNNPLEVQKSTLLSIKTGGCSEDCAYCPQAARYHTEVDTQALMQVEEVVEAAKKAKASGSSRFCMGAAWREVRDNEHFDRVVDMVKAVKSMDMEVCCTLGMLSETQAKRLADAGVYAYNHNLDTSEEDYNRIITTRTYQDRLDTISHVRKAGMTVCSGGIIGLGEQTSDRVGLLKTLSNMDPHPESVPINSLVSVPGTPMEHQSKVPIQDMVRMIATARILMPKSAVRLSAGRTDMTLSDQALCFMAGANSIFTGEKLLTTPNPEFNQDQHMFEVLGLQSKEAYSGVKASEVHV